MLTPPPISDSKVIDNDTPASAALKCAYALMQQRIISNPSDMMGVLLYGTKESKFKGDEGGSTSYPHCYLLADLQIPDAKDVKALKGLIEDEEESKQLLVPTNNSVPMSDVLFCANQIFTTKAPNFSSRRLFIVTDSDDPHASNSKLKSSAAVRAKDLYDLGVIIELFPISRPGQEFDRSKFYDVRPDHLVYWHKILIEVGHNIQRGATGSFSPSSHNNRKRSNVGQRRLDHLEFSPLLHQFKSCRTPGAFLQFAIGDRARLQNIRKRVHTGQTSGTQT